MGHELHKTRKDELIMAESVSALLWSGAGGREESKGAQFPGTSTFPSMGRPMSHGLANDVLPNINQSLRVFVIVTLSHSSSISRNI